MFGPDTIFIIIVIILSIIVHELAHGIAADRLGDPTPRYAGRLTLNPLVHLDLIGSVIVPILSSFGGFFFGWAKPVPYNPYNFKKAIHWGEAIVAAAGPLSNLALALLFGLLARFTEFAIEPLFLYIVAVNCSLFILNLLPIPPLDGSKILSAVLPGPLGDAYMRLRQTLEQNFILALILVLLIVNVFSGAYGSLVFGLVRTIVG